MTFLRDEEPKEQYTSKLTVLVRTSYRPGQFRRCIESIPDGCNIIVSYDDDRALGYVRNVRRMIGRIKVEKTMASFGYNEYCNYLLDSVTSGHCLFLDDDDTMLAEPTYLHPGVSYIVPFMRGNFEKPDLARRRQKVIQNGYIGLPCLVLWHQHKEFVNFTPREDADFHVIKQLSQRVNLQWRDEALVSSEQRGWGRMEK